MNSFEMSERMYKIYQLRDTQGHSGCQRLVEGYLYGWYSYCPFTFNCIWDGDYVETLVEVRCIKHIYPDKTQVTLCGLDFVVHAGEGSGFRT